MYGYRWGAGCPCVCEKPVPCGCNSNPDITDPWYLTDDEGDVTLTYVPDRQVWVGNTTRHTQSMVYNGSPTLPPDYGYVPNFQNNPVAITYTLQGCYNQSSPSRWLLIMTFSGRNFRVNNCPWPMSIGAEAGGSQMFILTQSFQTFNCGASMLNFTYPEWLNGQPVRYSCVDSTPGAYPVANTPGGTTRVLSR